MNDQPAFQAEVHQNRYLPAGGTVVEAVLTVTTSSVDGHTPAAGPDAAEVIMIDCSGSMANPPSKLDEEGIVGSNDAVIENCERSFQMRWPGRNPHQRALLGVGDQFPRPVGKGLCLGANGLRLGPRQATQGQSSRGRHQPTRVA